MTADLDTSYQSTRKSDSAALNSDKKHIFNIYAHVINIYRHRRSSLNNSMKDNTELNSLVKFWAGIFDSLFLDSQYNVKCRWGESETHHNDLQGRLSRLQKVDVLDLEAARYLQNQKTNNDHLKLAIESCWFRSKNRFGPHGLSLPGPLRCEKALKYIDSCFSAIKVLSLCDHGLYCLWKETNLSLPSCPKLFAEDADVWVSALKMIRTVLSNKIDSYEIKKKVLVRLGKIEYRFINELEDGLYRN
ncbi:hypothetical protein INT47_011839 [Mucor saturninus]|uniref:Uncharacterized protein n=1 Tax=Mucor saturninus TaxID=64648 RepID=A0A8H7RAH0_9FUNG|nr:hypothetical protein INT47_011839 [Mucor saturninus]